MRAAVVHALNTLPAPEDFPEPIAAENELIIDVTAGAVGPTDLMRVSNAAVSYYGAFKGPKVVGGEGMGRTAEGQRVYFGHSTAPYGSWAERTVVPEEEVWPVSADLPDEAILPLGISGTGALIPLEEARIVKGERVLILGATGPLGQIALRLARILGAGQVIGAARNPAMLTRLAERGLADTIVRLGGDDDDAALKAGCPQGYDVVLDVVYGAPLEAAIRATGPGARIMSIGNQAGKTATISLQDLVFRTHAGVATGKRPAIERRAAFDRMLGHALNHGIEVDTLTFRLDDAAEAWTAQAGGPHAKIIVKP